MYIKSLPSSFPSVPLYVLAGAEPTAELCANTPAKRWVVDHLPPSVRLRVADQLERLHSDWTCTCTQLVKIGLASLADWRRYVWSWLVVNTRCIHLGPQSTASSESMPPKASCLDMLLLPIGKRDSIALAPVLDLLNHSYQASVSTYFDAKCRRFVIKTLRPYHKGDEVFISYGPHDNGFMLAEYGFVLPDNPYCVLSLDHAVESWIRAIKSKLDALRARAPITTENIDTLVALVKQHGLWGDFALSLDTTEPPYRLQATLYLILAAMQGSGLKGAVSRWECWRHGKDINGVGAKAEAATLCWIKQTCTDIALHAQQMSSTIQTTESSPIDPFLVHCLGIIWSKIDAIARHHSRN
ncbi:hypothetical protein H4S02_000945 [Coemansia sp. RSA 2611]|nr:hypothetical protein H4S02_000945 [Coemansia sp. RSA 2611]